ncbi:MAG: hypothetical protein ACXWP4_28060 [Polyangiales bacterium]
MSSSHYREHRSAYDTAEPLLLEQVRAYKRMFRMGALTLAAIVLGAAGLGTLLLSPVDSKQIWGLAGIGLVAAIGIALSSAGDPRNARGVVTLRERSAAIVWMYAQNREPSSIVLAMEDGARVFLPAIYRREDEVLAAVARIAPHASIGFTPDREMAFLRDPALLRGAS